MKNLRNQAHQINPEWMQSIISKIYPGSPNLKSPKKHQIFIHSELSDDDNEELYLLKIQSEADQPPYTTRELQADIDPAIWDRLITVEEPFRMNNSWIYPITALK